MSCMETIQNYAFRSLGFGEKLLPREDITLCDQFTLIGSGMIWNIYFAVTAIAMGFFFANALALAKTSSRPWLRKSSEWYIFIFRGSPLFIQFFFIYSLLVMLPRGNVNLFGLSFTLSWVSNAWAGALFALFLNTSAYSAEIFYGALCSVPKGDLEAADAYGIGGWGKFRRIQWPTMLRLAWPSYTNEAVFLFHATTLVFFSSFPAVQQKGDALYYASYFVEKTFNPFISYPIVAFYFILLNFLVLYIFGRINKHLNRYLPSNIKGKIRLRPLLIR